MTRIEAVAVFCGSSSGHAPVFACEAAELGRRLAEADLTLVYGGGHVGLMGQVADGAVTAGGRVIGVIPEFLLRRERGHDDVAELIVTDSMHSRKQRMVELADAFVVFPGGLGTLDETFEILTWRQLGLHCKPIIIADIAGYAEPLLATIDAVIAAGFADAGIRKFFSVAASVSAVMALLVANATPAAASLGQAR